MNPNKISAYEFPHFQQLKVHIIYLNRLRFGFAVSFFPNITIKVSKYEQSMSRHLFIVITTFIDYILRFIGLSIHAISQI